MLGLHSMGIRVWERPSLLLYSTLLSFPFFCFCVKSVFSLITLFCMIINNWKPYWKIVVVIQKKTCVFHQKMEKAETTFLYSGCNKSLSIFIGHARCAHCKAQKCNRKFIYCSETCYSILFDWLLFLQFVWW